MIKSQILSRGYHHVARPAERCRAMQWTICLDDGRTLGAIWGLLARDGQTARARVEIFSRERESVKWLDNLGETVKVKGIFVRTEAKKKFRMGV